MSDRIDDLMYEAGLLADGCWDELDEYDKDAIENFARLIVKECADWIDGRVVVHGEELKKHFGVK